ncbi:hypothetical protein J1N10_05195 [Carboxylicivirga sp. A043]|uniref:glucosamine inositolphosphorylceramide transferase family protein n=1 Tax=Carboxylicivirga litoralis TaxID=2816963 RepID=UPI0021CAE5A8|nr:hypothetical protein [Carboxylicivirga sp. A043]MCU4155360.1 hypothetical protein [Carboxylicivirga sp. A043]
MDNKSLEYIVKKEIIKPLVVSVNSVVLPAWLVEVITSLANDNPALKIYLLYDRLETKGENNKKVFLPIVLIEQLIFRQKFKNFKPIEIQAYFSNQDNVIVCTKLDIEVEKESTSLYFDKREKSVAKEQYYLPKELTLYGFKGVVAFLQRFLLARQPYQLFSDGKAIWNHMFQTMEYSIDKNSGFFKAAFKQSIESIWCSNKKMERTAPSCFRIPGLLRTYIHWGKTVLSRVIKRFRKLLFYKRWFVVIKNKQNKFTKLLPEGKDGWADPFIIDKYLFVEQINADTGKGHLVAAKLNGDNAIKEYSNIVVEDFHLSYPNIFQLDNTWYMIPESAADKSLRLYEATDFPYKWKFLKKIQSDTRFLDFTPLYYNDVWWMFTISKGMIDGGSYDQLFLFYAKDFINEEWIPHPQNPIVTDSSAARPAGKLYWENGQLYRPSQDCFDKYGGCIKINKVVKLSKEEYKEELVEEVNPQTLGLKAHAAHTLNRGTELIVYDAQNWECKL